MADNQLICRAQITPANVDDSQVFGQLVDPPTRAVCADKIYDSKDNKNWLADHGIAKGICASPSVFANSPRKTTSATAQGT
ncbi:MAG TPA: transposase [Candidatus Methylacidiphilales bacterium]|jgi:IS5 family transposase|nr:transposase [Candidatus Methylacidiphilales bacterium]